MIGMQEEQDVESLLQHRIRDVILFSHMVHHVQESGVIESTAREKQGINKGSRSSVAEVGRRSNKFSSLPNSVCHAGVILVSRRTMGVEEHLRSKGCGFTDQSVYLPVDHCQRLCISFGVQLLA